MVSRILQVRYHLGISTHVFMPRGRTTILASNCLKWSTAPFWFSARVGGAARSQCEPFADFRVPNPHMHTHDSMRACALPHAACIGIMHLINFLQIDLREPSLNFLKLLNLKTRVQFEMFLIILLKTIRVMECQ